MHPDIVQIGHRYKADNVALSPASQAAGTRNGTSYDVSKYGSGTVVANVGAASGTPTTISVTYTLQTSPDGSSGWTTLKNIDGNDVVLTVTAASTAKELDFNLQYVPQDDHYLRALETVAFTGGTSPAVVTGATLIFGGSQRLPL